MRGQVITPFFSRKNLVSSVVKCRKIIFLGLTQLPALQVTFEFPYRQSILFFVITGKTRERGGLMLISPEIKTQGF